MDENKAAKLADIGYKIAPSCGLCVYGVFPNDDFGTCERFLYIHLKHQEPRELSINRYGSCGEYTPDATKVELLGRFGEYLA